MPYTATTLTQLTAELANRLSDPTNRFWTESELQAYLVEALRTWQAFTATLTTRVTVDSVPNQRFYDLLELVPELEPTVTDRDLILQIQRHLQEELSATSWTGTEQFTYLQLVQAIQNRRNQFLLETGMVLHESEVTSPTAGNSVLTLDETVIDVTRVMWKTIDGFYSPMWKLDQYTATGAQPAGFGEGTPQDYSTVLSDPLSMKLYPSVEDAGFLNLFTIDSGPDLDPGATATVLGIPDDFCWIIKFGAMADILGIEGPGMDKERAAYCEDRWEDGIKLVRISNLVRMGYIDGLSVIMDTIQELDTTTPNWVLELAGPPKFLGVAQNIIASLPVPDNDPHTFEFDVMQTFPVPDPGDPIPLGEEILNVIIGYAHHLAVFKEGGVGFKATSILYRNMASLAATTNDRLRAQAQNFDVLSNRSMKQSSEVLRRISDLAKPPLGYSQE